jgi:hypothetical protein
VSSFSPPLGAFQPHQLELLQQAFDSIWQTIEAYWPTQADDELRTAISERLCQIAAEDNVTDVVTLRVETLRSFAIYRTGEFDRLQAGASGKSLREFAQ